MIVFTSRWVNIWNADIVNLKMSTSALVQFKLNDVVQIGLAGRIGKIGDIVRLLGTYEMYKVM